MFNEIIEYLNTALKINPKSASIWKYIGKSLLKTNDDEAALECFNQAVAIDPTDEQSWMYCGLIQEHHEEYSDAFQSFDHALNIDPNSPTAWECNEILLEKISQHENAILDLDNAIKRSPSKHSQIPTIFHGEGFLQSINNFNYILPENTNMGFRKSGYIRNISTLFMLVVVVIFVFTSGCALFEHAPVAAFKANPTQGGPAPMTVTFTDKSSGSGITSKVWQYKFYSDNPLDTFLPDSYKWTTFSLNRDSSYRFEKTGSYDIKLIVTGKGGSDEIIKTRYISIGCDFSKHAGIERCFGGIGSQCGGIIQSQILGMGVIPFTKHEDTCSIDGRVSVGSIRHDRCCLATNNAGWSCPALDTGDITHCKEEWQEAWDDTQCSLLLGGFRQWKYSFGPYPLGNKGDVIFTNDDSIPNKIKAPSGTRINPIYQKNYCQSGKCIEENGITKIETDFCGEYCTCQ